MASRWWFIAIVWNNIQSLHKYHLIPRGLRIKTPGKSHMATPPRGPISTTSQALVATSFMILAGAMFAFMHGTVRWLSFDLHPFLIAFFRNLFGFLVLIPLLIRGGMGRFKTTRMGLHTFRACVNSISMLTWFTALSLMPLADATALALTGPLFVTLGAILTFAERVRFWRWATLIVGAVGALMVIRPGFEAANIGALLTIAATATAAVSKLCAKSLTKTEDPATIAAYVQFLMTPITFFAALFYWQWPTIEQIIGLIVIGTLGSLAHLFTAKAYAIADLSFAEPISFTRMIWATAFGYIVFSEVPDFWTWAGAFTIVLATSIISYRERNQKS
ncbi:MAG: RNA polymerase subunit sigma-54 [Rhodospirillaceae bacterium]|nr:RNA polymerase subunit sigma-54 [Rhodospirillaceae bacterium]|tara:strand:+ start:3740 stop:4738 length:999 start_codon:yes stop_codon:yes gene_type:complete